MTSGRGFVTNRYRPRMKRAGRAVHASVPILRLHGRGCSSPRGDRRKFGEGEDLDRAYRSPHGTGPLPDGSRRKDQPGRDPIADCAGRGQVTIRSAGFDRRLDLTECDSISLSPVATTSGCWCTKTACTTRSFSTTSCTSWRIRVFAELWPPWEIIIHLSRPAVQLGLSP